VRQNEPAARVIPAKAQNQRARLQKAVQAISGRNDFQLLSREITRLTVTACHLPVGGKTSERGQRTIGR